MAASLGHILYSLLAVAVVASIVLLVVIPEARKGMAQGRAEARARRSPDPEHCTVCAQAETSGWPAPYHQHTDRPRPTANGPTRPPGDPP